MRVYRETPGKYKIYLTRNQCMRLIGFNGKTILQLREKYKKSEIKIDTRKFYVEFSGNEFEKLYKSIMRILLYN